MSSFFINNTSDIPIYQQLYKQIESQILNNELKADSPLPSIRTMAKELRISIITVKKTWEELEKNSYIYTVKGKGSYIRNISEKAIEQKKEELLESLLKEPLEQAKELDFTLDEIQQLVKALYK